MTARAARCDCGTNLVPHCARSIGCSWWRCPNAICRWDIVSLRLRRRMSKPPEKHVEAFEVAS